MGMLDCGKLTGFGRRMPNRASRACPARGEPLSFRRGDIPLPGGFGYLLPQQRSDEFILYGPGSNGFQLSRWSVNGQTAGLIPYSPTVPPVSRKDLQKISWILQDGDLRSEATLYGELVQEPKLLGAPATAGEHPFPLAGQLRELHIDVLHLWYSDSVLIHKRLCRCSAMPLR